MISPQQVQYILALVEHRSISKAAKICFVTQPTLSMQLKKAEEVLGRTIFERKSGSFSLTKAGKSLLPYFHEIASAYNNLKYQIEVLSGQKEHLLRIGIIPTVASYLVLECFEEWKKKIPQLHISIEELKTEDLIDALEQKKIDLGILSGPITNSKFSQFPLFSEEILVYFPEKEHKQIELDLLSASQAWLLSKGNCLRTQVIRFCEIIESSEQWEYQGGNIEMLIRLVDQRGGYTLVPENYQKIIPNLKVQRIINHEGIHPARSIIGISNKNTKLDEAIRQIIHVIQFSFTSSGNKNILLLDWN